MRINQLDKIAVLELARNLMFEHENIMNNHNDTDFCICTDEDGGAWEIKATYKGKYNLYYAGEFVEVINNYLELILDEYCRQQKEENYNSTYTWKLYRDPVE